jgi:hypothetical protein
MRKKLARKSAMSRAQRAHERDKVRSRLEGETADNDHENSDEQDEGNEQLDQEDEAETPLRSINGRERKRRKDVSFEPRDTPKKRSRLDHDEETDSIKRISSLAHQRPNPMNLARSSWAAKGYHEPDAASDSEVDTLDAPRNEATRLSMSDMDSLDAENWRKSFSRGPNTADHEEPLPMSPVGALTFKPSPGHYAKRRWSSEVWASNATRDSSPNRSEQSDADDVSYSDDDTDSIDMNIDYKKRYSVYYITQRDDDDTSSSGEEVCFDYEHYTTH